nr:MAG TPA: hypothetical protein [Caudoviricetes sp.]
MGRKGGIASGKARRRKRDLRKMMQMVVDLSITRNGEKGRNCIGEGKEAEKRSAENDADGR